MTGIGFLGAGTILRRGDDNIVGATTGAGIWAVGGLGLAIGYGFYILAVIGALFIFGIFLSGWLGKPRHN